MAALSLPQHGEFPPGMGGRAEEGMEPRAGNTPNSPPPLREGNRARANSPGNLAKTQSGQQTASL